jgi:hypothetical protein
MSGLETTVIFGIFIVLLVLGFCLWRRVKYKRAVNVPLNDFLLIVISLTVELNLVVVFLSFFFHFTVLFETFKSIQRET